MNGRDLWGLHLHGPGTATSSLLLLLLAAAGVGGFASEHLQKGLFLPAALKTGGHPEQADKLIK